MTPLIDATEMYLRTVWELEEEGITPIRARLVERLGVSAPAVSETVAKLVDEGLLRIGSDRTLSLTESGRDTAVSVMRKHRLAERLLVDVIGVPWEDSHNEACRWEHVISDEVEQRIAALLDTPVTCPHGNPIPTTARPDPRGDLVTVSEAAKDSAEVVVARFSEFLQTDVGLMRTLADRGILPGVRLTLRTEGGAVTATLEDRTVPVPGAALDLIYVLPATS